MNIKINLQTVLAFIGLLSLLFFSFRIGDWYAARKYNKIITSLNSQIDSLQVTAAELEETIDSLTLELAQNPVDTVIHTPEIPEDIEEISVALKNYDINTTPLDSTSLKVDKENAQKILLKADSLEQCLRIKTELQARVELLEKRSLYQAKQIENLKAQNTQLTEINLTYEKEVKSLKTRLWKERIATAVGVIVLIVLLK